MLVWIMNLIVAPCWCSSQRLCAETAAAETAAHEGDDNTCLPSGPRGDKNDFILRLLWYTCMYVLVNVLRLYTRWNIKIQAHSCIVWFSRFFADPSLTKCCCQNYCPGCATDNKWKCSPIWPRNLLEASNQSCKGGATNSLNIAFSESGPWTKSLESVLRCRDPHLRSDWKSADL